MWIYYNASGGGYFKINPPIISGEFEESNRICFWILYNYYTNLKECDNHEYVMDIIDGIYRDEGQEYEITDSVINKICDTVLSFYPQERHKEVIESVQYNAYITILKSYKKIKMIITHGDFAPVNIKQGSDKKLFLFDYEQPAGVFPLGYDKYHYLRYLNKSVADIPYIDLNEALYNVIHLGKISDGMELYTPQISVAVNGKRIKVKVVEIEGENIIRGKKINGLIILDMKKKLIGHYAFHLLIQKCFSSLNDVSVIYVYNSIWRAEKFVGRNLYCGFADRKNYLRLK